MKRMIFFIFMLIISITLVPLGFKGQVKSLNSLEKEENNSNLNMKSEKNNEEKQDEEITTFSSNTCYKRTYYINNDNVELVKDNGGPSNEILCKLKKDSIVIAYNEKKGYIYCEDANYNKGWIKKNKENLKGNTDKENEYKVDIDLTSQKLKLYYNDKLEKDMICSTGIPGNSDTETPVGKFFVTVKGTNFYSNKYQQGAKYYIQFFGDYLIHSVPTDVKGNIIEEEEKKLGEPVSHGCIRVSMENSKWLYDNLPVGAVINIHY